MRVSAVEEGRQSRCEERVITITSSRVDFPNSAREAVRPRVSRLLIQQIVTGGASNCNECACTSMQQNTNTDSKSSLEEFLVSS